MPRYNKPALLYRHLIGTPHHQSVIHQVEATPDNVLVINATRNALRFFYSQGYKDSDT